MNRRRFLTFLGLAPIAVPLAVKAAADTTVVPWLSEPPPASLVDAYELVEDAARDMIRCTGIDRMPVDWWVSPSRLYSDELRGVVRRQWISPREFYVGTEDERRPPAQDLQQTLPHPRA